jgi:hypothetical protein
MRLACGLAIALWLSFPAAGMASRQQDPAGSANAAGQAPAAPAPKENAPAEATPAAEKKAPENAVKEKTASGTTKRRQSTASAPGAPRKTVVREGGANQPAAQIAPDITPAEAARQRQNAEQLLSSTGAQLKRLAGRTLNARQQETVGQIRNYMDGARAALQEGDVRRAGTLAQKAHLLAEDLLKH